MTKNNPVHFIGIGGIGMSGIADILLEQGYKVSGSDLVENNLISRLRNKGATIFKGHSSKNIVGYPIVVYSSAIDKDNPEILEARKKRLMVLKRAQMLCKVMKGKTIITVAGTHGKTTTTSLVALMLKNASFDPSAIIGGEVELLNGNTMHGAGKHFITEADESDGSLIYLRPNYSIITNIEEEHFGFFKNLEAILNLFKRFIRNTHHYGKIYYNADDQNLNQLFQYYSNSKTAYSIENSADICARNISLKSFGSKFQVVYKEKFLGEIELKLPGLHNISNSLGPIALASDLDIPFQTIKQALQNYRGVNRRFQIKADINNILIIDDYAHHPTEIKATLDSARNIGKHRRIIGIFQPHRYSRTKYFREHFSNAFRALDQLILTDIYSAYEKPIAGIDGKTILERVVHSGQENVEYFPNLEEIPDYLIHKIQPGDIVVTMGAGNIHIVAEKLAQKLKINCNEEQQ